MAGSSDEKNERSRPGARNRKKRPMEKWKTQEARFQLSHRAYHKQKKVGEQRQDQEPTKKPNHPRGGVTYPPGFSVTHPPGTTE
jgi:hypothetical protein